jgi:hypothetical protein
MNRPTSNFFFALILLLGLSGCATSGSEAVWTTLLDGERGLENFNRVGGANWTAVDGAIQAIASSDGSSHLVSKNSYKDFILRIEFWTTDDGNSGVHMRCEDPRNISSSTCYEVNIYDQREDPSYGTGGIVDASKVFEPYPKAGGKWNTFEITARGDHLIVIFNGIKTADVRDSKHASGVFSLQWGRGTIKFRKVEIRSL